MCPEFSVHHIDAIVVTEASVCSDRCVGIAQVILLHVGDVGLRQTDIGSQLFDITLSKWIDINPLITTQEIIHSLEVDALTAFELETNSSGQVVNRRVAVVEVDHTLLDIVVTTLHDIAGRTSRVVGIIGIVGSIERIPVDLGCVVITASPEIYKGRVGVHIHRWTNVCIVVISALTHWLAVEVFIYKVAIFIDLTIIEEGWQVAVVVRTWIRCVVEGER